MAESVGGRNLEGHADDPGPWALGSPRRCSEATRDATKVSSPIGEGCRNPRARAVHRAAHRGDDDVAQTQARFVGVALGLQLLSPSPVDVEGVGVLMTNSRPRIRPRMGLVTYFV